MVNGTVDKNNICSNSKSDEEIAKHSRNGKADVVFSSSDCANPSSRKSSNSEASLDNDQDKTGVGGEEVRSRTMAEVPTKTSLFCSVPLNKIHSVSNNAGGKIDEENSAKLRQISRKLLCLYCDRTFVSSNLRQKHVERCHSEKQSRRLSSRKLQSQFTTTACFYCDKLPVEHSLRQLFEHLISVHSQKYFGCLLCEERFLNQIQLNDHNTKLHNLSKKRQQKLHSINVNEGSEKGDEPNEASNSNTDEISIKEHKSTKTKVKKKRKPTMSKPPPRQLRNKKKVSIKASKVGLKRSKRLQSAQNKVVPVRKKKTKTVETAKSEENNTKTIEKIKSNAVNPYPEFDSYYRVKKITDHSIDNLKISSLTFDDVFDKAFFNRIKCNIQENLLYHLDGKLFKNEESENRISNFEKNPPTQEVSSTTSENYGCDLSLNAITPVTSILTPNFGEDLESQIEYGSKPSKKKMQIRQDPVRHKYVTRRKYQASILEHKENRDLSKLDMWTQLVIKDRQQKVLNGKKSAKEMLEYTTCAEYKLKIQRNELNRILDRRGPFEDLKEEASKKAALEQLNSESHNEINEECFKEVRSLMEDVLTAIVKNCSQDEKESDDMVKLSERVENLEKEDIPELPEYLKLRRTSSVPSEEEIDKSDKIALICSSQETENYELPTNTVRNKNEMVELSGEWARSRIYVCAACGLKVSNMKLLIDHKSMYHQYSWVQHYELVGNQSELYRHLSIPGLGKVGHIEETVPCKSWLKSGSRVCTKCEKVCNSLSELHRHILECAGDWTWMLARKKCKYRPFGARKKRRGLVKRIRVSNQKTDQTEKKKYKKTFEGPRQRPSDAETIQRMLANLPPKRSSRKSICMKDGFPRNRQKSPKNKKQVMKCGKIVRHKSTYATNPETTKNPSNHKNASVRQTLRSLSRTLSSKILDTNSKLKVKRQLIQNINRRSPRKNSPNVSEVTKNAENEKMQIKTKKNVNNGKNKEKADVDKVKSVLKEKVNIKSFFPVSKIKASKHVRKISENSNSDPYRHAQNIEENMNNDTNKHKPTKNVMKLIKKSLNIHKRVKPNLKNDSNLGSNSEPIVVIEKLPQVENSEEQPIQISTTKKLPNKRKLRSSFRKVIDKVKKLKLDNSTASIPCEKNKEVNIKPDNSFLGQGAREKEKLATVLVPLVEELKESPLSNLVFVQNVMDNNSPTEESLIPENIFNLQHNSEDLLQAKSPLETITVEVRKHETNKYFSTMSAKVSNIPESTKEDNKKILENEIKNDVIENTLNSNDSFEAKNEDHSVSQKKEMSLLSIDTTAKSDKSPLISPILSPSLLSPKVKGKLRKPNRGLNDCIAMLTKKAFEGTHKTEIVQDVKSIAKPSCLDNTNEAHKIIRANECILKIPVIESSCQIQTEVLDLSKPKKSIEMDNISQRNTIDISSSRSSLLWNSVKEVCNNQASPIDDFKIVWPIASSKIQNTSLNSTIEKAILKIPKFVEISRSNNIDNVIQGVIENYAEPVIKSETVMSYLKVPSIGSLNTVDKIIEEVVKGNLTIPSNEENSIVKIKSSTVKKSVTKGDNIEAMNIASKTKKATRKNKQDKKSLIKNATSSNLPSISPHPSNNSECLNTLHEEGKILDIPQLISTSSTDSASLLESKHTNPFYAHLSEIHLPEKSQENEEYNSIIVRDSKKILTNSEDVDVRTLDVVPISITLRKKACKKTGQRKKGVTKQLPKNTDDKIKEEYLKVEKTYENVSIKNSTEIPTLDQTNEPDILEDKQIPVNDTNIMLVCSDLSLAKPIIPILPSKSETTSESLKSLEDLSICHHLEEHSNNKISISIEESNEVNRESMNLISAYVYTSSPEKKNKLEEIVDTFPIETNSKNSATDSEDELPLLILKRRNKKDSFQDIPNTLEETKESEINTKNGANILGSLESKEVDSGNCEKEKIEVIELVGNATPLNKLITGEFPFPNENEKIYSDSNSNREFGENARQNCRDRRKSPRRTSNPSNSNKHERNAKKSGKGDRSRHSFKFRIPKNVDGIIEKEEILENISTKTEIKNSVECCLDISEKEKFKNISNEKSSILESLVLVDTEALEKSENFSKEHCLDSPENKTNIPIEQNLVLKPSESIELPKKPKNFLDTNLSNFRNNIKNTRASLLKSTKTKKKNKNKHDSIKTKLIFKFPKIILKEPVLRIPPRNNISESITSFGKNTDNSQDKSIKLMLENPFSSTKILEENASSISSIPESSGNSNEVSLKNKSSNKKKSNKHKKRLLKCLAREESIYEATSNDFQNTVPEETTSTCLKQQGSENNMYEPENIKSSPDNSNILSALSHSTSTSFDDLYRSKDHQNNTTEITLKLPITMKIQPNPSKKYKSKNSKKKKDKVKMSSFPSDTIHIADKFPGNNFSTPEGFNISNTENTNECKQTTELSTVQLVNNIEYVPEEFSIPKSKKASKFETETNKLMDISSDNLEISHEEFSIPKSKKASKFETETNKLVDISSDNLEISHEALIFKPPLHKEQISDDQSSSKLSNVNSTDNTGVENDGNTTIKSGRSLRSTVKITYKQSNIFALQIEDKEISDLKIIEKPKYSESQSVPSTELLLTQGINKDAIEETIGLQHKEESSNHDLFEEAKISLSENRLNSKIINCQEVPTHNGNLEESLYTTTEPIIKIKNSNKNGHTLEDRTDLKLLEMQELGKEVKVKSKKSKRSSKVKKVSNKSLEINSTIGSEITNVIGTSDGNKEVENEYVDNNDSKNEALGEIGDVVNSSEPLKENIQLEENKKDEVISSPNEIFMNTHTEKIDDSVFATSGKYEDSSFSEGELIINESFEIVNVFEESSDSDKKLEIVAPEMDNLVEENVQQNLNSGFGILNPKKLQKNRKHKKERSPKKSNTINCSVRTNCNNQNEISLDENNDIPLSGMLETTMIVDMSDLKQIGEKNTFRISSNEKLEQKTKDEFEFEEDMGPLDNLKSKFKNKKNKEAQCKDITEKSNSLFEDKLEIPTSISLSPISNMQSLYSDANNGRKQRTAKSKALENINIIETKFDLISHIELTNDEKPRASQKHKNKISKHKEQAIENDIKGRIREEPLEDEKFCEIFSGTSQRKSRAAKAKAIENIKVSEIKSNDIEIGSEKIKKNNITDGTEKLKKMGNCKERNSSLKGNEKNLLKSQTNLTNSTRKQPTKEDGITKIPLSELSSDLTEECSPIFKEEGHKSIDGNKITEKRVENADLQHDIIKEKNRNAKNEQNEENDSISKIYKRAETISSVKRNELSAILEHTNKAKKNIEDNSGEIYSQKIMENFTNFSADVENYSLANSFSEEISFGTNLNKYKKLKNSDSLPEDVIITKKSNEINCYDIDKIDEDNDLGSKDSRISKKKKKSIKNDKKVHIDNAQEILLDASTEESHIQNRRTFEVNELVIHDTSTRPGIGETEQIDSLDVTLKTTVDEISSILMEDKCTNEIPYPSKKNDFGKTFLHTNMPSGSGMNCNNKKLSSGEPKPRLKLDELSEKIPKKKRFRDDTSDNSHETKSEIRGTVESGSMRRSKRACKVNTYNENYLAEAIFEQSSSEKNKTATKKADDTTDPSSFRTTMQVISEEVFPEKKMNSDELFDLLKTTTPDNLIALKPVEENPSDTPHTDDNFDDEFDDILRKSQALFGEKPYEKLDDICRSDDSSSTSKLTDFERLDENTEPIVTLKTSEQSYISETTFSNSIISASKNEIKKSEELPNFLSDDLYCDICRKTFKRIDNLIKHKTTLTHIAKLSEMEAKEAQKKLRGEEQGIEDSCSSNIATVDFKRQTGSTSYSYSSNSGNNALKIAEIITEAFEKPAAHTSFSEVVPPLSEHRRYKSLGERKSFECDQGCSSISENIEANPYESKISNNTGCILEKQINLLQNIVGIDYTNDASISSYHSLGNSIGQNSPVSVFSSKLEDSTNLGFPNDLELDGETERTSKVQDFLKPSQIEDISEDSINLRNSEDVKSRKVLNRDEELFLECCSLLKSGSEVSNFSKKSNRNSLLNNASIKMAEEPDVLESKKVIYKVTEDSSDYSTRATPLGDSFGDTSNSNTISSSWEMNKNNQPPKNQENLFNFSENEKCTSNNEGSFYPSKFNNKVLTDAAKSFPTKIRKSNSQIKIHNKEVQLSDNLSSKMPTKGALKIFDGLKVSIPTDELNLEIIKKKSSIKKTENISLQKIPSEKQFLSPKTPRRKSKPVKNKPQIDERFIFKVNKKPSSKDTEEKTTNMSKESITDKITDVYDFEETQDNTDVFAKPDFKSFRNKGTEIVKGEIVPDNNFELQTMSSSSSSTFSGKKTNECITKKKHMIMGRIFKNAVKPKLDEEIRDIPPIDHNELVENYVMSCTPKHEDEFKKPKMTEEEMNYLFDKLLDKPTEQPKKSGSPNKTDCKNTGMKKKLKLKCKKRHRSNSDSTDDEFGLNKIVKKRPGRKNAREEDNSINLEQELKECIGVASRKSQRKCTSGKQNVLVEYWSSDESAFETFLENQLQELSEKSETPISKEDKQVENNKLPSTPRENPINSTCEKNKKTRMKPKDFSKKKESRETTTSNETFESSVQSNRRKRTAAHPLYHWSSSSEDELQDLIEVKSMRDDPEDEYDEERPVQHGWIVGDSPKKLVTMLAQAKGKKTEPESLVKEQGKKKNSNS